MRKNDNCFSNIENERQSDGSFGREIHHSKYLEGISVLN